MDTEFDNIYDLSINIDLITDVADFGWGVKMKKTEDFVNPIFEQNAISSWDGTVVAVVGLYDKGKTFFLNSLTKQNLPSGKKMATKGICFK